MKIRIRSGLKCALFLSLLLMLVRPSFGQDSGFGLGLIVWEPTGLSLKNWMDETTAWDFAAAWSIEGNNSFNLHGDYLKHRFGLFPVEKGALPLYFGIGAALRFNDGADETAFGGRVPVGVDYHFEDIPLALFLEIVPVLDLFPETDFRLNAAIGARFFFGAKN